MNYIWELAIRAIEQDIDNKNIVYKSGTPFSPYMELSFDEINNVDVLYLVDINPYYRYYAIFKELLEPNVDENEELIEVILDTTIHHLKDIDVLMGMNKRDYHIHFIIRDLYDGHLGEYVRKNFSHFTRLEQKIVANNLLSLYTTAEGIYLLKDTIRKIFKNAYIFSNAEEKDEIVLYLRTNKTAEKIAKIEVIKHLFLPFKANILIYWEHIFGVIGVPDLMKMGEIMNY